VFICYVSNIFGQQGLTNEKIPINGQFLNTNVVPEKMRAYKSCCHLVAAMIMMMYMSTTS